MILKIADEFMDFNLKPTQWQVPPWARRQPGAAISGGPIRLNATDRPRSWTRRVYSEKICLMRITAKPDLWPWKITLILDTTITPELKSEGLAREMVSRVQQLRKQKDFNVADRIRIYCYGDEEFRSALEKHKDYIMNETLALEIKHTEDALQEYDLNGHNSNDVEKLVCYCRKI